jgi:hypothetical protein
MAPSHFCDASKVYHIQPLHGILKFYLDNSKPIYNFTSQPQP